MLLFVNVNRRIGHAFSSATAGVRHTRFATSVRQSCVTVGPHGPLPALPSNVEPHLPIHYDGKPI